MKKRIAGLALVTLLVMAQASSVFAAGSTSTSTTVTNTSSATKSDNGSEIQTGTVTVNGETVTVTTNSRGEAVVGNTSVSFANGSAATAGLPTTTVEQINAINAGQSLAESVSDVNLTGYNALGQTMAIVTKNNTTGAVDDHVTALVNLYVPNLLENLGTVQILFFNNATGRWELLTPVNINAAAKQISVYVPGSGTLSVVYRR